MAVNRSVHVLVGLLFGDWRYQSCQGKLLGRDTANLVVARSFVARFFVKHKLLSGGLGRPGVLDGIDARAESARVRHELRCDGRHVAPDDRTPRHLREDILFGSLGVLGPTLVARIITVALLELVTDLAGLRESGVHRRYLEALGCSIHIDHRLIIERVELLDADQRILRLLLTIVNRTYVTFVKDHLLNVVMMRRRRWIRIAAGGVLGLVRHRMKSGWDVFLRLAHLTDSKSQLQLVLRGRRWWKLRIRKWRHILITKATNHGLANLQRLFHFKYPFLALLKFLFN